METLARELAKKVAPIGSIEYFALTNPPAGYLKADGSAVWRETYPELFAAIGTTFGEGDGVMTFNLPDLIGRFAEGNATPGTVKEAGLPNVTGEFDSISNITAGAFTSTIQTGAINSGTQYAFTKKTLDASRSNPIYGASDTVQPPALTLLPCIKAFYA